MDVQWAKLVSGKPTPPFELRLRRSFAAEETVGGEKVEGFTWIIAAAYAERDEEGAIVGILGCITDISRQKWAEGFQKRKMLEAVELKRQQENFIDMTSHEMRNPLSAIIQCADSIGTSLSEFDAGTKDVLIPREILDNVTDAGHTIVLCAQHQKRIIDDILTLSKLDSDLLAITPIEVQPIAVIRNALKMFDGELQKSDMDLRFRIEPSWEQLSIDWVKLDPSRLLQIFINLITNAIKFTQSESKRKIVVSLGASLERPKDHNGLQYLPRSSQHKDQSSSSSTGEVIYLTLEVIDSGRGLNKSERNLLFRRFSQASPRTHVQYGGSGLGLFISRQLTEIQGGQIGVASQAGIGSTFAFYIHSRRCSAPDTPKPLDIAHVRTISPGALSQIAQGPTALPKKLPITPRHILIVEDNIVNQKVLSKQLRGAGCIVSVANHGGEALTFLSTSHFCAGAVPLDLVLMDLEMPVMDGLTCVRRIRQLQLEGVVKRHVPVIAVTANARSEQIAHSKDAGMDSVVTKPFRIPDLVPEMERVLRAVCPGRMEVERSVSAPPC
ncbi:Hybrid signal transduction histidine kinase K [Lachnellula suecica]|uniref:Hybrid signal transduction histidine kinase K n=1 Tax=Lachnellula suecica TaxID=602035 RepID=A0A8T9CHN3_9HELO|nr:Hybrid signal transduction histidine kinase K [Lachnellula suecica]